MQLCRVETWDPSSRPSGSSSCSSGSIAIVCDLLQKLLHLLQSWWRKKSLQWAQFPFQCFSNIFWNYCSLLLILGLKCKKKRFYIPSFLQQYVEEATLLIFPAINVIVLKEKLSLFCNTLYVVLFIIHVVIRAGLTNN